MNKFAGDIDALREAFEENADVELLYKRIEELENKNKQLQAVIDLLPKKNVIIQITPEEMICIEQIARLKNRSQERDLTLEETKKLDILIKSLKLIRDEAPKDITSTTAAEEEDLVAIAAGKTL